MEILYHPDIISKIFTAFTTKMDDTLKSETSNSMIEALENIAYHRITHLYTKENSDELIDTIPMQVSGTLHQFCNDPHEIDIGTFQPENIPNNQIRDQVLELCKKGTFVPFLLIITHDDLNIQDNYFEIVFGIGEDPDNNFAMMSINIPEYIKDLDLTKKNSAIVMYPMIFDVPRNCMASTGSEESMHIRIFTKKETEEISDK